MYLTRYFMNILYWYRPSIMDILIVCIWGLFKIRLSWTFLYIHLRIFVRSEIVDIHMLICQTDFPSGCINAPNFQLFHILTHTWCYLFSLVVLLVAIYWNITVVSVYFFMMTDEVMQVLVPVDCCITNHLKILPFKLACSDTSKDGEGCFVTTGQWMELQWR